MTRIEIFEKIFALGSFKNKTATEIAFLIKEPSIQKTNSVCLCLEKYHYYLKSSIKDGKKMYSTT